MIRPYVALFRVRMVNGIQYRVAALAGIATQFAWGFMLLLAFMAFYESNPHSFPMTMSQTVTFMWMQQAFLVLFMLWRYDNSIFESIEQGHIAYDLVRPMDLYSKWFTTNVAMRLSGMLLRCVPVLVVAFVLPPAFRITAPASVVQFLAFALSLALSLGVVVAFTMVIYVSAFYTINSQGTRTMAAIGGEFLAGAIIPIPFFPDHIRRIMELTPFGSMQNTPLLIFAGVTQGRDIVVSIALQVFWIVALVAVGRLIMGHALRRVITQGG